jgi:hypothetical protein
VSRGSLDDQEAWLFETASQLYSRWEAKFGKFTGHIECITAVQSAVKPLMKKYGDTISDFIHRLTGHQVIELVVAGREGFLTDRDKFMAFFDRFSGTQRRYTVYISGEDRFIQISRHSWKEIRKEIWKEIWKEIYKEI